MGIDYDGGMIVGCYGDEIGYDEEKYESFHDFIEENDIDQMSMYYDADIEHCIYGVRLKAKWALGEMDELKEEFLKAKEQLESLFNTEVFLYGTRHIY